MQILRSLIMLSLLASACRPRTDSELRVSNPDPAGKLYPAVVDFIIPRYEDRRCGGVFIKPRLLLTAAHCVYNDQGKGVGPIYYAAPDGNAYWGEVFPSRKYRKTQDVYKYAPYDLALISFNADVVPEAEVARLAASPPTVGESMTIVGFGKTDIDKVDNGTKRVGYTRLQSNEGNLLVTHGVVAEQRGHLPGQMSSPMPGDRGGGIFNEKGELTGIVSSGFSRANKEEAVDEFGNILWQTKSVSLAHPRTQSLLNGIKTDLCAGNSLEFMQPCPRGGVCGIM